MVADGIIECTHCNARITARVNECPWCGAPMRARERPPRRRRLSLGALLMLMTLLGALFALLILPTGTQ